MKLSTAIPTSALGVATAALLAACGSSNQSNTVATVPSTPTQNPQTTAAAPATTPTQTTPPATKTSPQATRTAPAPAFVQTQPPAGTQLAGAVAAANHAGYTVPDTSTYRTSQTLRVLIGERASGGRRVKQAFFFIDGRYIGTDSSSPSASLSLSAQNDTAVTLRYGLYRNGAQTGTSSVQFALNNGKLTPLDPIPPASSRR